MKNLLRVLPLVLLLFTSCHRTTREVWEDSKTCGRYIQRGFGSLFGRHSDVAPFAYDEGQELDYTPLMTEDDEIAYSDNLAPSKESPGEPGSPIPGIDGFYTPSGELAALFASIHFETDNYSVKGEDNVKALNAIADYLQQHPKLYVFVEGHADERGPAAYNLSLGSKRANNIRSLLAERGIDPDRLFTISYGKERPVAFGHDESCWWQNRRGQFRIFEKG